MMRSMYSGVSGLRVHQTKMDVIGNNIANVNTIGYKKSQASFQEAFSQVVSGGSAPSGGAGGTNPMQIGLGLQLGSITTVHTTGATQRTDNPTDLMIGGDGFFMVSDDSSAEERFFTRAGNFSFDVEGNLVTSSGYKLLGTYIGGVDYAKYLGVDSAMDIDGIKVSKSIPSPATASSMIEIDGNLDSRLTDFVTDPDKGKYVTDAYIKDSLGNSYKLELRFEKDAVANTWSFSVPNIVDVSTNTTIATSFAAANITFDGATGAINAPSKFNLDLSGITGALGANFGPDEAANPDHIDIDLSKITQFANDNSAKGYDAVNANDQIGKSAGAVTGFTISDDGKVIASFDNGVKKELWQIKLATFDNPSGLIKSGSNFFEKSPNSGEPMVGNPKGSGFGALTPGALEMSNVDLSMEFTEMITTQRGFQANSRIITTTDEMLQELVNMKR